LIRMFSIRQKRVIISFSLTALALVAVLSGTGCQGGAGLNKGTTVSFFPLSGSPFGISIAGLDRDEAPDIAVIAKYRGLYLWMNQRGAPAGEPVLRKYLPFGLAIDSGDFNGDGITDLAYVVENNVQLLVNDGSGTDYDSSRILDGPFFSQFLKVADLNNDGVSDIVAVGALSNEIYVHLSDGPLSYHLEKVPLSDRSLPLPSSAKTLDIGDIDGDGFKDLIIPEFANNALWLVFNNNGKSFTPRLAFTLPPEEKIMHASFLFYDKNRRASFIALAAGSYNPKLIVLSCDGSGTCLRHESVSLPYPNPNHIALVIRDNAVSGLLITHYRVVQMQSALSYVRLNTATSSLPIITGTEPLTLLPSYCVMSVYHETVGILSACQNPDGIAFIEFKK
jgi:hypothetical protein